jgi:hypothetical protein
MKPYVLAFMVVVVGLIILGVATATLMNGSDKPDAAPPSAGTLAGAAPKGSGGGASEPNYQPQRPAKPAQPAAAPLPGTPIPLSTTVQPAAMRPPGPQTPPSVAIVPVDPMPSTSSISAKSK